MVVLAWFKVIPLEYGWLGFAIVVPSFIVETILKKECPLQIGMTIQGKLLIAFVRIVFLTNRSILTAGNRWFGSLAQF